MRINPLFLVSALLVALTSVHAKDLGVKGERFPILEEDFSVFLTNKMQAIPSEYWIRRKEEARKRLVFLAKHPSAVSFLKEARKYRSFHFDPSHVAKEEVKNSQGKVVVLRGQKVNPLHFTALSSGLAFFDGDNDEHIAWAKQQKGNFKWVLVKGAPIALEEKELLPVYFDQGGKYTSLFGIRHIPARVTQAGDHLLVEEIPLGWMAKESGSLQKGSCDESAVSLQREIEEMIAVGAGIVDPDSLAVAQKESAHPSRDTEEKKCSSSSWLSSQLEQPKDPGLFVFISFSIPRESWKALSLELERAGGVFILNGIPKGSFPEFVAEVEWLRKIGVGAPIQIDPLAFLKYSIESVPAIVLSDGQLFDKVEGNIPLRTALDLFLQSGSVPNRSKVALFAIDNRSLTGNGAP